MADEDDKPTNPAAPTVPADPAADEPLHKSSKPSSSMPDLILLDPALQRQYNRSKNTVELQSTIDRLQEMLTKAGMTEPTNTELICLVWLCAYQLLARGLDISKLYAAVNDARNHLKKMGKPKDSPAGTIPQLNVMGNSDLPRES